MSEEFFESLHFAEAPKIVVEPPGPKSREYLERQKEYETSALYYTKLFPIAIDEGFGATVKDVDGNVYIDWVAGIAVMNVGHRNPIVMEAIRRQMEKIFLTPLSELPSDVRLSFLSKLVSVLPGKLRNNAKVMFTVTGADAVEAAVSLARWKTKRSKVIVFEGAYHGVHHGAVGLTANKLLQKFAGVPEFDVFRVPYPYPYRCPLPVKPEDCGKAVVDYVDHILSDPYSGAGEVAAILVEPIQGEGGYIVPPDDFLPGLREVADKHDVLLILDEIQTGVGRTGKMWATEHWGVTPDIICIGKAIGAGYPMSLVAYRKDLDEGIPERFHLGTFRSGVIGLAAGVAALEFMEKYNVVERARYLGEEAIRFLEEELEDVEIVGEVRGKGMMIGIELVQDRNSKKPMASDKMNELRLKMLKKGLLVHTAGHFGNVFRIMSPLVISRRLMRIGLEIFTSVLKAG